MPLNKEIKPNQTNTRFPQHLCQEAATDEPNQADYNDTVDTQIWPALLSIYE